MSESIAYAVVASKSTPYQFTIWHDTSEQAQNEAARLAAKIGKKFFILKVVGYCAPDIVPIKKEMWE